MSRTYHPKYTRDSFVRECRVENVARKAREIAPHVEYAPATSLDVLARQITRMLGCK